MGKVASLGKEPLQVVEQMWIYQESMSKCKAGPWGRDSRYSETPKLPSPISLVFLFPWNLKTLWVQLTTMVQKTHRIKLLWGFLFQIALFWGHIKESFHMTIGCPWIFVLPWTMYMWMWVHHSSRLRGLACLRSFLLFYGSCNPRPCPSSMSRWCQVSTVHLGNSFTTGCRGRSEPHSG